MDNDERHLPMSLKDAADRGWDRLDVILVTGDAFADHPAFPAALLGRVLESVGYRVGVISRPDPQHLEDIARLGLPRLFFGITAGSLDSMVGNYTALKRRRSDDPFAPGGMAGGRPDRALTVYCHMIRRVFAKTSFLVAGGLEASLRRFAHYDYWSDSVRRPILMDCGADVLVHGMGEGPIVEIASRLDRLFAENQSLAGDREAGRPVDVEAQVAAVRDVPGVVYRMAKSRPAPSEGIALPSCEEVAVDPDMQIAAFRLMEKKRDRLLWQDCSGMRVIANPAWPPLSEREMDRIYALPFTRNLHPSQKGRVPALEQVRFGVTTHRGCFGGCAFCAISAHQGKTISSRSAQSILDEVRRIAGHPDFRGTITDLGGPSANMYGLGCNSTERCERPSCLWPKRCRHLRTDQTAYLDLLRKAERIPKVKRLFVTTGIRTDLVVLCEELVRKLACDHTSGIIKVAPEHLAPEVLHVMRKPIAESFNRFLQLFRRFSKEAAKEQYVLPYLMAAHPGCDMEQMALLRRFLVEERLLAEQCQIFTPTPGTASTVMYATGLDLDFRKPLFVEKDPKKKQEQKEMILHHLKKGPAGKKHPSKGRGRR